MENKSSSKSKIAIIIAIIVVAIVLLLLIVIIPAVGGEEEAPPADVITEDDSAADVEEPAEIEGTIEPEDVTGPEDVTEPDDSAIGDSGLDATDLPALISALPDTAALKELHSTFMGYWISGNEPFVGLIYIDDVPGIDYGLYRSSFGVSGKIIDAHAVSATEAEFTILIPAMPETAMNDATPERTEIVSIDISNYNDQRLNFKTEGLAGGAWQTYEYGGATFEAAAEKMG